MTRHLKQKVAAVHAKEDELLEKRNKKLNDKFEYIKITRKTQGTFVSTKKGINFDLYLPRNYTEIEEKSITELESKVASSRIIKKDGSLAGLPKPDNLLSNRFTQLANSAMSETSRGDPVRLKADFEKNTPRGNCFKPNTLTKNVSYHPKYNQIEKKSTQNFSFSKMIGRFTPAISTKKITNYTPNYEAIVPERWIFLTAEGSTRPSIWTKES